TAAWLEAQAPETAKENEADIAKQKAAGIQVIEFKGAEGTAFHNKAYEAGWAGLIKQSPEHGPKLKEFLPKARWKSGWGSDMQRISALFGRVFDAMMLAACLLLLFMTLLIGADVVTRNLGAGGIAWSNEVSENILYLITLLSAPWLLRQGQHIRVDILL